MVEPTGALPGMPLENLPAGVFLSLAALICWASRGTDGPAKAGSVQEQSTYP
jgi:hypothetical protein